MIRLTPLLLATVFAMFASPAQSQAEPTSPEPAPDVEPTPPTPPTPTPPTPPTPTPPTPTPPTPPTPTPPTTPPKAHDEGAYAAPVVAIPVRVYGTIKPTVILSNGLETFGFQTLGATTAASNPAFDVDPDAPRLSFQIMQTRFGLKVGEGTPVVGQIEVDFLHFDQSSPVQQAFPRLRIAVVEWTPGEGHKLMVGQTWDIFSPLGPHTFNMVAAAYQSGNSGFMRDQIAWFETVGAIETVVALGLVAPNASPNENFIELALTPTLAARSAWKMSKSEQVGISAIATNLKVSPDVQRLAWGVNAFTDLTFGSIGSLNLRAEAYSGANLANLGTLTLGQGHVDADIYEAGGFVSAKLPLGDSSVYATLAGATVLNPDDMKVGYTPALDDQPAVRVAANGPGLSSNATARLGGSYSPFKGFSLVAEPFLFASTHKLDPADAQLEPFRLGLGIEAGALYSF